MNQGYPVNQPLGKTGSAPIVKVGHTYGDAMGSEPMAKGKGLMADMAKPQEFGK